MVDIAAIKSRLSDPREVAALLGLRVEQKTRNGVLCRCPVHGNKSGALWLRYSGGKLKMSCFGCGIYGDAIDLLAAIEGDFKAGLARAEQFAGGSLGRVYVPEPEVPRLDPEVYHELAERILDAGRLDGRAWVWEVEGYLARRRLLELARADGWACLPGLKWLLKIAEEVCDGSNALHGDVTRTVLPRQTVACEKLCHDLSSLRTNAHGVSREKPVEYVRARDLLISADLARYNQRGEFVPTWGRWRLVIPWRGPDGRITSLQRRRTWAHDGDGPEPAKYVFPRGIRPEWPYGSERVGYESAETRDKNTPSTFGGKMVARGPAGNKPRGRLVLRSDVPESSVCSNRLPVAIVEGAVDVLAMRALHPSFTALGLPGIGGWRADWAKLVGGASLRICLDRGKPDPHGVIPEDRASARIALDCAGRGLETERVLEWLISRHRRGRALFCVLCGQEEAWLCRGCGRRRAPAGMDWGKLWERQATP